MTWNAVANGAAQLVNFAYQFGSVSLFIYYWPTTLYGNWILLSTIPAYLGLADIGLPTIAANDASMFVAQNRRDLAERSIHTATGLLVLLAAGILAVSAAISYVLPWDLWLIDTSRQEAQHAVLLLGLYAALGLYSSVINAAYRASYLSSRGTNLNTLARIFELIAIGACIAITRSLSVLALAITTARALSILAMHGDMKRADIPLRPGLAKFDRAELIRSLRPALQFMAFPIGNALYYQGVTVAVSGILGPVAVVVFNSARALTRGVVQIVTILRYSAMPEFSFLAGKNDIRTARKVNGMVSELALLVIIFASAVVSLFGMTIFKWWTHAELTVDYSMLLILVLAAALNSAWSLSAVVLIGMNRHGNVASHYVLVSLLGVAAVWIGLQLVQTLHLVALTMVICEAVMLRSSVLAACESLRLSTWQFVKETFSLLYLRSYFVAWRHRQTLLS